MAMWSVQSGAELAVRADERTEGQDMFHEVSPDGWTCTRRARQGRIFG